MKAFYIFTATLESVRSLQKDILLSIFHEKSTKIAVFSCTWEDVWKHSNFTCFLMKNTQKYVFVNATYGLESGCKYLKSFNKVSFTFQEP